MRYPALALALAGALLPAGAWAACTRPAIPACAIQDGGFANARGFDECRLEMLAYRDGIDAYATCLQKEAPSPADEQAARDEFEDTRIKFNQRARATPSSDE